MTAPATPFIPGLPTDPWFDEETGECIRSIPEEAVADCSASGDVTAAVEFWVRALAFEAPQVRARERLRESGGWSWKDIEEMSDLDVNERVLWCACCEIAESGEFLGVCS